MGFEKSQFKVVVIPVLVAGLKVAPVALDAGLPEMAARFIHEIRRPPTCATNQHSFREPFFTVRVRD
jgi:hypothetical protein